MNRKQIVITKQITFADKIREVAKVLRACKLKQGYGVLYDDLGKKFCAIGALEYLTGTPRKDLQYKATKYDWLKRFGFTSDEICAPLKAGKDVLPCVIPTITGILYLNDTHFLTYIEIADWLELAADNLDSEQQSESKGR